MFELTAAVGPDDPAVSYLQLGLARDALSRPKRGARAVSLELGELRLLASLR